MRKTRIFRLAEFKKPFSDSTTTWIDADGCRRSGNKILRYGKPVEPLVLETVSASDWSELDWTKTSILTSSPDADTGMLDRDGKLHACEYENHYSLCTDVLGVSGTGHLLSLGWVHVEGRSVEKRGGEMEYRTDARMTKAQAEWLLEHGHTGYEIDEALGAGTYAQKVSPAVFADLGVRRPSRLAREGD